MDQEGFGGARKSVDFRELFEGLNSFLLFIFHQS